MGLLARRWPAYLAIGVGWAAVFFLVVAPFLGWESGASVGVQNFNYFSAVLGGFVAAWAFDYFLLEDDPYDS